MTELETVVEAKNTLGEGLFWNAKEKALYWLDSQGKPCIQRLDPKTGAVRRWEMPDEIGSFVFREKGGASPGSSPASTSSTWRRRRQGCGRAAARPGAGTAGQPTQRRQVRPCRALLVRQPRQHRRHQRQALPHRPRSQHPSHGDRRHHLQRHRLEPGQQDHVLRQHARRRVLGLRLRPGERNHRQPPHLHRHQRHSPARSTARPWTPTAATGARSSAAGPSAATIRTAG